MKAKYTGERLETSIIGKNTIDHLHRYAIAANYAEGKTVLDIASGEGYGSNILAKNALQVYGVDIDSESVEKAQAKYRKSNLKYITGSADAIPLESNSIDLVVSFETIEHHDKHDEMYSEIMRVLKEDGLLIISTPDKLYYSDKRNYNNPYHVKELYKQEFLDLTKKFFGNVQLLTQKYSNGNSIMQDDNAKELSIYSGDYSSVGSISIDALYLVALASNASFEKQGTSIFDGEQAVGQKAVAAVVYRSTTYRVGHFVLSPLKFLKKFLKKF